MVQNNINGSFRNGLILIGERKGHPFWVSFLYNSMEHEELAKLFFVYLNAFNYLCTVLRNRHISKRAFSNIIPYWNLDNFKL